MPGIGPFKWIDPAQVHERSIKTDFTLGVQRCRPGFSDLRGRNIKLTSAKVALVLKERQPGLDALQSTRAVHAKNCLTALIGAENTLCEKLNNLHEAAGRIAKKDDKNDVWERVRIALIDATESISTDGLEVLRDRTAQAYRGLGETQRTGVEGRVLRALHKQLNHRLSAEKGLLPKGLYSTKSREYGIARAGLRQHVEAQAGAQVAGKFKYLSKKTVGEKVAEEHLEEADIAAIGKIVESASNDAAFFDDVCNEVIFLSKTLVGTYERNGEAALRQAMAKTFTAQEFIPDDVQHVIDQIGTAGKSIAAVAAKQKDSPANRHVMQRAKILILLHDAYYLSKRQAAPSLKNDGQRTPVY